MKSSSTPSKSGRSEAFLPWMRDPVDVDSYEDLPLQLVPRLDPRLVETLQKIDIDSLFPIQAAVWQETVGPGGWERDICIESPTGTGKTLSYALPIVQMLSSRKLRRLRALVVLPTRDLAQQVKDVFCAIAPAVGLQVGLAVGQSSIAEEVSALVQRPKIPTEISYDPEGSCLSLESSVDILVATPGRLMDHINTTKGFTLEHLCYLVVDETDRLLREAYQHWLPTVLQLTHKNNQQMFRLENIHVPTNFGSLRTLRRLGTERGLGNKKSPRLMKMALSATLTRDPSKLSLLDLHHPLFLTTGASGARYQLPLQLESYKLICNLAMKPLYLFVLLQELKGEKSIVFTSSVSSTDKLGDLLNCFDKLPCKISVYSRRQHQSIRSKTLDAFRSGHIDVLVASDAMTRGMDIEGVKNVINYDTPPYIKTYIHRAGRTARAGRSGRCFTLLPKGQVKQFDRMLRKAGVDQSSVYPLSEDSLEGFKAVYSSALEKWKEIAGSEKRKSESMVAPKAKKQFRKGEDE